MPLKLSIGLTKKRGLPGYSSVAASCHVEVELAHTLLRGDLDRFHRYVRKVFVACREAVSEELLHQQGSESGNARLPRSQETVTSGNDNSPGHRNGARLATVGQVSAIESLAQKQRIDLATLLSERFQKSAAHELSIVQASKLIDELKLARVMEVEGN